jgi:methylated-DNA-protein-cysteine methyltransferase-like protein
MDSNQDFFVRVYEICMQIPRGRVTTYGAIARAIGAPQSARMVGWAMNKCHSYHKPVPAHRVLNRNGMLTGKRAFGNTDLMRQLLEQEGVPVQKDRVLDFEQYFWDPAQMKD